jgi:hypothetical protein
VAQTGKKEKPKKRKITCGVCGKKVALNKKSCCPNCGAIIVID